MRGQGTRRKTRQSRRPSPTRGKRNRTDWNHKLPIAMIRIPAKFTPTLAGSPLQWKKTRTRLSATSSANLCTFGSTAEQQLSSLLPRAIDPIDRQCGRGEVRGGIDEPVKESGGNKKSSVSGSDADLLDHRLDPSAFANIFPTKTHSAMYGETSYC